MHIFHRGQRIKVKENQQEIFFNLSVIKALGLRPGIYIVADTELSKDECTSKEGRPAHPQWLTINTAVGRLPGLSGDWFEPV